MMATTITRWLRRVPSEPPIAMGGFARLVGEAPSGGRTILAGAIGRLTERMSVAAIAMVSADFVHMASCFRHAASAMHNMERLQARQDRPDHADVVPEAVDVTPA